MNSLSKVYLRQTILTHSYGIWSLLTKTNLTVDFPSQYLVSAKHKSHRISINHIHLIIHVKAQLSNQYMI